MVKKQESWQETSLTYDGLFAYFDQMADASGMIVTTSEWLAEVGMLIVNAVKKARSAQNEWREIKSEADLPTRERRYIWQYRSSPQTIVVQHFGSSVARSWVVSQYSAYQECPAPFTPKPEPVSDICEDKNER